MKLVSYRRAGAIRHGRLLDEAAGADAPQVQELGSGDLEAFLRGSDGTEPTTSGAPTHPLDQVELLAPLTRPGKLLAVAANYQDHVTESGAAPLDRSRISPRLFLKPPTSILHPGAGVPLPSVSREVDYEAELAVVIGRTAKDVSTSDALDVVAGYTIADDVSARSVDYGYPRDVEDRAVWFFDWLAGKWLDGFCPMGPYLLTADEVADPQCLDIELRVNGDLRQQSSTRHMIFSVAELVSFASRLMTLEPGDVLLTGTPSGVGVTTGTFLQPGDEVAITLTGLGTLTHHVS